MEALTAFLGNVGAFFDQSLTWIGSLLTTINGEPALQIMCFGIPIAGVAFGYLGRLIRS